MLKKLFHISVFIISLFVLVGVAGAFGFTFGYQKGNQTARIQVITGVENINSEDIKPANFGTFWYIWKLIEEKHLNGKSVNPQTKVYGAIQGLVQSLGDPYSEFFNPEENKKFQEDITGNFGGIGAEIGKQDNMLIIVAPLKKTPAEEVGLAPGDQILLIDRKPITDLSVQEAVQLIRGPVGSRVKLTIFRKGWTEERDIDITRAVITVPTLEYEIKESDIVYVELMGFNPNAVGLFREAMIETLPNGAKGLILDLRNNPGGLLDVAVDIAGWFFKPDTLVLTEVRRDGTTLEFRADGNAALDEFPIVVLVNKGSASASEILAGALRDNRDVPLVGEQTFGKGLVQQLEELSDGSSIKLTTARWILPSGGILDKEGLVPDYAIEQTEEDLKNKSDPQLEKAMELIRESIKNATKQIVFTL